ncbi:MAG: hypothetical protein P8188_01335 [Gemmatimonadota bacterium]|jgi:hypothetical protein
MRRLSPGQRFLLGGLGLVVVTVLAFGVRAYIDTQGKIHEVEALRATMLEARAAVDACFVERDRAQSIFDQTDRLVDSLRAVVSDAEIPLPEGGRGVDEDRYPAYLGTVEAYNLSVREWGAAADSLESVDARCRPLVEAHNVLVDSLTGILEAEGVELPPG